MTKNAHMENTDVSPFNADQQFPTFKRMAAAWPLRRIFLAPGRWALRVIKKTYKYTLGLIVLLVLAHVVTTLILGQMLKEDIAALKARGAPVSVAGLAGPKIPDSENGAVLYTKAFELVSTPQALKDQDVIEHFLTRSDREKDPSLWTKAAAILPRYDEVFRLVEEASSRPKCRFSVDWEKGLASFFPHHSKVRQLAQLACTQTLLDAKHGRMEDAVRSAELSFRISDALREEPTRDSYYTRASAVVQVAGCVADIIQSSTLSESQSRRLFEYLKSIELGAWAASAIRTDAPVGIRVFDQIYARQPIICDLRSGGGGPSPSPAVMKMLVIVMRPMLYADERYYIKKIEEGTRYSRIPYREQRPRGLDKKLETDIPTYAFVTSMFTVGFSRTRLAGDRADASVAAVRTLLALAAYKDRFGSYPSSLADLETRLGWKLPEDPFSGKPLVYRQKDKGFVLYSLGENLKDDGAKSRPLGNPYSDGYDYYGADGRRFADIIWQMDH